MPGELAHLAAISGRVRASEQTEVAAQVSLIEVSRPHRHRRERGQGVGVERPERSLEPAQPAERFGGDPDPLLEESPELPPAA